MILRFTSLNSGSNGNSYYIGDENDAILVDAGLSRSETEKRLKSLRLDINKVRAVFISHEHTDHISGIRAIVSGYNIPVYATPGTLEFIQSPSISQWIRPLVPEEEVRIGRLSILPFSKHHDAADPISFNISQLDSKQTVGVFTDIGRVCDSLIRNFKKCHAAFLESNYDEEMLKNGRYPFYLKQRISGEKGHLSNEQALQLFRDHKSPFLQHLILSHLSAENNCPDKVLKLFTPHAGSACISIASRSGPSSVFTLETGEKKVRKIGLSYQQTKLF